MKSTSVSVIIPVVIISFVGISCSAPQSRVTHFHEHLEDFLGLIISESGLELENLLKQYGEKEDFCMSMAFLRTTNFRDIVHEVESSPEFKKVVKYLEEDHIDILYLLGEINELLDNSEKARKPRHSVSCRDLNEFVLDFVKILPKEKLEALLEQKKNEDKAFRKTVVNLQSRKWNSVYSALWESDNFQKQMRTLALYGIDVNFIVNQIKSLFGKKYTEANKRNQE